MKNEGPKTDAEFEAALAATGAEVIDHGDGSFSLQIKGTDGRIMFQTLGADDYSKALFEAWSFRKA